jgi:hypothetical protein
MINTYFKITINCSSKSKGTSSFVSNGKALPVLLSFLFEFTVKSTYSFRQNFLHHNCRYTHW